MARPEGSCVGCRLRRHRGHETGPCCVVCARTDPRVLRRAKLREKGGGELVATLCALCACIAGRRPLTVDELRREVFPEGDRRQADRRIGDRRTGRERRDEIDVARLLDADRRERSDRRANA
jgi:hypothetical protein